MLPTIIVHGGAGAIDPQRIPAARAGCEIAARAGQAILLAGGSAIEAVVAAIAVLEDNPLFNAGTGAVLNTDGFAELDAGLMDGATLDVGAAIGLRTVKNPIHLAAVILRSEEVLLAGEGAERQARAAGLTLVDPSHFIQAQAARQMRVVGGGEGLTITERLASPTEPHGTVGAVAIDQAGHCAAGSSTGGYAGKPLGRVGDTPIAGAGFYAEDVCGGASCTGMGEYFIRMTLARQATALMAAGYDGQAAGDRSLQILESRLRGAGGLILIDPRGGVGWARNTAAMPIAYCQGADDQAISAT